MSGTQCSVIGNQANFLLNVLRLKGGDHILLFNGRDGEWLAVLDNVRKREAVLRLIEKTREQSCAPDIDYCFAPIKHARLDYIVQKAVEMGAARLRPIMTRRTQVSRLNLDRMRANAIEAAEQCGILSVPEIFAETPFERFIAQWPADRLLIFCDEDAEVESPVKALQTTRREHISGVSLLIGPEGGFDEKERALAQSLRHSLRLSLGPRILRADTAGVAAMAIVQNVFGDWA